MTRAYIQPPADSTGKKIELDLIQNPDGVDTYRQRIADGQTVRLDGEMIDAVLLELKLTNYLLGRLLQAHSPNNSPLNLTELRNEIKMLQFIE